MGHVGHTDYPRTLSTCPNAELVAPVCGELPAGSGQHGGWQLTHDPSGWPVGPPPPDAPLTTRIRNDDHAETREGQ
eukprot:5162376-Prymnesium_polylepis.2